jgi:uncharacterized protein with HEPN domain
MSEPGSRGWHFYLGDMIGFAEKVIAYTDGLNQAGFVASSLNYDATVRNLELIGEAATHVPDEIRRDNPQIPWRLIIATRNRLIHGYLGIDNDTLWSIIQSDIPPAAPTSTVAGHHSMTKNQKLELTCLHSAHLFIIN